MMADRFDVRIIAAMAPHRRAFADLDKDRLALTILIG
jgi:hypothetical protein